MCGAPLIEKRLNKIVAVQGNIQAKLRPATWIKWCYNLHSEEEKWDFDATVGKEDAIKAIVKAGNDLPDFFLREASDEVIIFDYFTPAAKWMDEIRVELVQTDSSVQARVVACALGVLPVSIPFSFLLNALFCWLPFGDNGKNAHELSMLRKKVEEINGKSLKVKTLRRSQTNSKQSK
jgi:hypothetical protein